MSGSACANAPVTGTAPAVSVNLTNPESPKATSTPSAISAASAPDAAMTIDLSFFGLEEDPFNQTPDPRFLHMTPGHQEALAQLVYGVQRRTGFILLTGEIGTGKTTLLQALLRRVDDRTAVTFLTNSMLGFEGRVVSKIADSLLRHHRFPRPRGAAPMGGGQ